jgi:hypothetical protein
MGGVRANPSNFWARSVPVGTSPRSMTRPSLHSTFRVMGVIFLVIGDEKTETRLSTTYPF